MKVATTSKSVPTTTKGKLIGKGLASLAAVKGKPSPPAKPPTKGGPTMLAPTKKAVPVKKDEDGPFIAEFAVVKECATCDCFEIDTEVEGIGAFFHRKNDPQRIYLKHSVLRAQRVRITVEVVEGK